MEPAPYSVRYRILCDLLDSHTALAYDNAFIVDGESGICLAEDEKAAVLDTVLLRNWNGETSCLDSVTFNILERNRLKHDDFDVIGCLGDGQFGVVEAVRFKMSGQVFAMKTIEKTVAKRAGRLSLSLERHVHRLSNSSSLSPCPNLVAAFQTELSLHLITTYAECGSLWNRMCALFSDTKYAGRMLEGEIQWWGAQMVSAIGWLHNHNIVHRDIKPHNFLIKSDHHLQITDFGSAAPLYFTFPDETPCVPWQFCVQPVGTPDYLAPEVLILAEQAVIESKQVHQTSGSHILQHSEKKGYSASIDWWSLGSTLYEMATGKPPFFAETIHETYEKLITFRSDDLSFPTYLSSELVLLLKGLINVPVKRLSTATMIQKSPFFQPIGWIDNFPKFFYSPLVLPDMLGNEQLQTNFQQSIQEDEFTLNHFFDYSDISSVHLTPVSPSSSAPPVWSQWVGWSFHPDPKSLEVISAADNSSGNDAFMTPIRNKLTTCPFTPDIMNRPPAPLLPSTHSTKKQVFQELLHCVQMSAKKHMMRGKVKTKSFTKDTSCISLLSDPGMVLIETGVSHQQLQERHDVLCGQLHHLDRQLFKLHKLLKS
ncbi:cAMP-dependent protein kinase, putative [Cryptococcus deneoformans JEC21]|uniref:cAMP-dependent protein kinase, putative n=1 Tax=Cryptococcus deneoformans (strain JEC21 / ATCC MYA-565) TaxID=214684 RepID=Q5KDQ1_CRYD1|nr:cAMP-dependent protein kinase, putative [Cryptococcus neoformans var. neoformans JEC21]AAW44720.1 cAMP-dependent protein kinase, putative [Cryptococcus neoformans var. neoformans JEC21]